MILIALVILVLADANNWHERALRMLSDLDKGRGMAPWAPAFPAPAAAPSNRDRFGITMLFPSIHPESDWFAAWDRERFIDKSNMDDPGDERSMSRGNGSLTIRSGEMTMNGDEPRYYVRAPTQGWVDTEFTVYCRVQHWLDSDKSAISLISRSRHHHIHKNPCDARGYYARFYFADHRVQLKKEFRHDANGTVIYSPGIETTQALDPGFDVRTRFLGIKSVVRTNPDGDSVNLRIYFDLSVGFELSFAATKRLLISYVQEGHDGGDWQLLLDYDDRDLEALQPTHCRYEEDGNRGDSSPIFRPGQVNILRSDAVDGLHLKWASIRAI